MSFASRPREVAGWVSGLVQNAEAGVLAPGTIQEGRDLVPTPAGRQRTRGGSRVIQTLVDDNAGAELDHICAVYPFTPTGALVVGWSDTENKHYAYLMDADMAFAITDQANSRFDMTASPSTTWDNGSTPARPVMAEVWEKMYVADAVTDISARNEMLAIDSAGTITRRTFIFGSGSASAPYPYCVEEYNGVLFMAGYGTEDSNDLDRPEMLRHSFLGKSPDAADGFDADAWALIGAKGQRITALKKGRGILLVAKENELYRVSGAGRAYRGWQYQIEQLDNTVGLGVVVPKALTFAEGYWWGISRQGPIRSDGYSVELLVGPRLKGWAAINSIEESWVRYHPERRLVMFGVHPAEASSGRSATFPWEVWTWDLTRNVFQTDHRYGIDLAHASTVTTTAAEGPSAPPSSPSTDTETTTGYRANWTNGDTSAQTELWEKEGSGGTWSLVAVIDAATAVYSRTGVSNHTSYYWRVRHRKNGVTSAWDTDAGTLAQTLIAAPGQVAARDGLSPFATIDLTQNAGGTDLVVEKQVGGGGYSTWNTYTAQPAGDFSVYDSANTCGDIVDYRSKSVDSGWPTTDSAYSAVDQVDTSGTCI